MRYEQKRTFGSNFYLGKDFSRKTIGTRMKRPSPLPKNYYEWQRPPDRLFCRKFDGFKKCYCKLKQRIMGEMGKEKWFVVPQDCIQIVWGVETPCNGLHASLLYFHYLSSLKFDASPKHNGKFCLDEKELKASSKVSIA